MEEWVRHYKYTILRILPFIRTPIQHEPDKLSSSHPTLNARSMFRGPAPLRSDASLRSNHSPST